MPTVTHHVVEQCERYVAQEVKHPERQPCRERQQPFEYGESYVGKAFFHFLRWFCAGKFGLYVAVAYLGGYEREKPHGHNGVVEIVGRVDRYLQIVVGEAAHRLAGASSLKQHGAHGAEKLPCEGLHFTFRHVKHLVDPAVLILLAHHVAYFERLCAGTFGVREDVQPRDGGAIPQNRATLRIPPRFRPLLRQ